MKKLHISDCPNLLNEWDYEKNKKIGLLPDSTSAKSNKKAFWKCAYGHSFYSVISNRYYGRGCPHCRNRLRTSFPEQAVYFYIKKKFPNAISLFKSETLTQGMELDIYIPDLKIGIEYDGIAFHTDKHLNREIRKYKICRKSGITLLRLKENKEHLKYHTCDYSFLIMKPNNYEYLNQGIRQLIKYLGDVDFSTLFKQNIKLPFENNSYESSIDFANIFKNENIFVDPLNPKVSIDVDTKRDRIKIYESYLKEFKSKSLAMTYPEIAKEWHPIKNGKLKPTMFMPHSGTKLWWRCKLGHEWQASPAVRTRGNGCPICSGNVVLKGFNDLASKKSEIAKEWDYEKNYPKTPDMFTYGSGHKAYWICSKGHSYQANINHRTVKNAGCPYCAHEKPIIGENDLATLRPDLMKEWDYEKNIGLKPEKFMLNSNRQVYWKCSKCGYSYKASIANRTKGTGCANCRNMVLKKGVNDLETLYPEIAKEWDYEKNYPIKPCDVFPKTNKTYYFKCSKYGHSWKTAPNTRISGSNCPICSGNVVLKGFNDIETTHSEIAKEWHPTKNGNLKPSQISKGYSKKLWWLCSKCNTEYQSYVANKIKGFGKCPVCSGRIAKTGYNDLATLRPDLMKDWDWFKNTVNPKTATINSWKEVFWKCHVCGHEWIATIHLRTHGSKCLNCLNKSRKKH